MPKIKEKHDGNHTPRRVGPSEQAVAGGGGVQGKRASGGPLKKEGPLPSRCCQGQQATGPGRKLQPTNAQQRHGALAVGGRGGLLSPVSGGEEAALGEIGRGGFRARWRTREGIE